MGRHDQGPTGLFRATTTAATFPPNRFGLYDMHGNVWEHCRDMASETYADAPSDGGAYLSGAPDGDRILRGGSWSHNPAICRSAFRNSIAPDNPGWLGRVGPESRVHDLKARGLSVHQTPVLGIEVHGSAGGSAAPFCNSSIEMLSGVRMNAMRPSRGGRLIVDPRRLQLRAIAVDVVDLIGEMAEIAAAGIGLRVPVVGQLHQRRLRLLRVLDIAGRGEEDERVAAFLVDLAARLDEPELAVKKASEASRSVTRIIVCR